MRPRAASIARPDALVDAPAVLQVLPAMGGGGVPQGAIDVANAAAHAGWRSYVASSGGRLEHALRRARVEHLALPLASKNPLVIAANVRRLTRIILERRIGIVHARSRAPAWSAYLAARRTGARFVTTFHGTYEHAGALKRRYNAVMVKGERVIAISHFVAEHIRAVYGVGEERVQVIHRGVDLERFDPAIIDGDRLVRLAKAWRIPDGVPVILMPGRLTRWKGQPVLIEALARLGRRDAICVLVGGDEGHEGYRRELGALAESLDLSASVRFAGHCDDMPAALMLADVAVSASVVGEAFGRVIAEAQAMGRPVVASDHGGAREIIVHGDTGWLVAPGDAAAMAEGLRTALALSAPARHVLAARARRRMIERGFSREQMCDRTLALYDELIGAPETEGG